MIWNLIIGAISLLASSFSNVTQSAGADLPELEVVRVMFCTSAQEISGATLIGGRLHVVADGPNDLSVYAVRETSGNRFELETALDLGTLSGWRDYVTALVSEAALPVPDRLIDFESLCACGDDLYLANERARHILRARKGTTVVRLPIDFSGFKELQSGGGNAGLEGVAVDCANGLMYVAKERSPRGIFTIRVADWKVLGIHDLAPFAGSAGNTAEVAQDFSDLTFDRGYLYVLERFARQIVKVDPSGMKVVTRFSYESSERGLYDTDPRFGLAEGLALSSTEVILGLDNNRSPLSAAAQQRFGVSGNPSAIIYLRRPTGF